jgi:phenylalanyl-tRNA synthetase beta chain
MFVVGKILSVDSHPDPKVTKLKVTQVDIASEKLQIVTNADVVNEQKVVVATIGHEFPDFKIEQRNLRGVESFGTFCGEQELGLPVTTGGLFVPGDEFKVGQEFKV